MIKITKVNQLKIGNKDTTSYRELRPGTAFTMLGDGRLRLKSGDGHYCTWDFCHNLGEIFEGERVIVVDAEINWCFK